MMLSTLQNFLVITGTDSPTLPLSMFFIIVQLLLIPLSQCEEQELVSSSSTSLLSSMQEDTVHLDLAKTNYRGGRFLISFTEYNTTTSTISTSWWCWTTNAANPPTNTCSKR